MTEKKSDGTFTSGFASKRLQDTSGAFSLKSNQNKSLMNDSLGNNNNNLLFNKNRTVEPEP